MLIIDTLGNDEVHEIVYGYGSYGFKIGSIFKPVGKVVKSVAKVVKKIAPIALPVAAVALPFLAPGVLAAAGSAIGSAATGIASSVGGWATGAVSAIGAAGKAVLPVLGSVAKVVSPAMQIFSTIRKPVEAEAPAVQTPTATSVIIREVQAENPTGVQQSVAYTPPTVPTAVPAAFKEVEYNAETNKMTVPKEVMDDMIRRSNAYNVALGSGKAAGQAALATMEAGYTPEEAVRYGTNPNVQGYMKQGYPTEEAIGLASAQMQASFNIKQYMPYILMGCAALVVLMILKPAAPPMYYQPYPYYPPAR